MVFHLNYDQHPHITCDDVLHLLQIFWNLNMIAKMSCRMDPTGLEPITSAILVVLIKSFFKRFKCKGSILPLNYGPIEKDFIGLKSFPKAVIFSCNLYTLLFFLFLFLLKDFSKIFIGGDPPAGSPTGTLCWLNLPCHTEVLLRRALPKHNSVGLTGGVYREQWHYSPDSDKVRLLRIPASWGWVTSLNLY